MLSQILFGFLLCCSLLELRAQALVPDQSQSPADSITISMLRSDNPILDVRAALYPSPLQPSDSIARVIRAMTAKPCPLLQLSEDSAFNTALSFVHSRWKHDPLHSVADRSTTPELLKRAERGERFTCVEYAKVLSDILIANGFVARMVGLSRRNISNPLSGARHVGVEVWSCHRNKWIYLDPQFGFRVFRHDSALTARELQLALRDSVSGLHFEGNELCDGSQHELRDSMITQFKLFIRIHNAFLDIPYLIDGQVGLAMLVPDDRNEPLLFQGEPLSGIEYTKDAALFYAPMGQVHAELQYDYHSNSPQKPLEHPSYTLRCSTSFPWIRQFEYHVDNMSWQKVGSNELKWQLHPGKNEMYLRALCSSGCYTRESHLSVYFGLRSEARKIRREIRERGDVLRSQ